MHVTRKTHRTEHHSQLLVLPNLISPQPLHIHAHFSSRRHTSASVISVGTRCTQEFEVEEEIEMVPAARSGWPAAAAVLVVVLVLSSPPGTSTVVVARAALSCSTVYNTLLPCLPYVQSGGAVPAACCGGIRSVVAAARTTADRRAACTCLKNVAAGAAGGPYISRAAGLPGRCGVSVPFKISPNVNCNAYVKTKNQINLY